MSRYILCTMGTRGDIDPFIAISKEINLRGGYVDILSNENWREASVLSGAKFHSIAPEDPPQNSRNDGVFFRRNVAPAMRMMFSKIEALAENGERPTVVFRSSMFGAEYAALRLGLPAVRVALQPSAIRSVERPPWPLYELFGGGRNSRRKAALGLLLKMFERVSFEGRCARQLRRDARISASRALDAQSTIPTLVMCPAWFSQPQADWPSRHACVGFPDVEPVGSLDPDLRAFMERFGKPLVFTPGTGVRDASSFFDMARRVCERLELPGLLLSPHAPKSLAGGNVLQRDYCDLGLIAPRARAMVHHGGIGTTAQCIRAGIPQVVVPDRFDQPDNAMRVAEHGLGFAVLSGANSPDQMARVIGDLLGNPHVADAAARAARKCAEDTPMPLAMRMITSVSAGSSASIVAE